MCGDGTKVVLCRCTQIKTYSFDNAQVILVGNKCDMEDDRVVSFEKGKQLADSLGMEFFETSAKDNINVRVSRVDGCGSRKLLMRSSNLR